MERGEKLSDGSRCGPWRPPTPRPIEVADSGGFFLLEMRRPRPVATGFFLLNNIIINQCRPSRAVGRSNGVDRRHCRVGGDTLNYDSQHFENPPPLRRRYPRPMCTFVPTAAAVTGDSTVYNNLSESIDEFFPKERGGDERVPFTRGLLSLALSIARLDVYWHTQGRGGRRTNRFVKN